MAIDRLINNYFSAFYNIRRRIDPIRCANTRLYSFSLTEDKILGFNEGELNIQTNHQCEIYVCFWEQYFNQFDNLVALKPKRCDLLIELENKHLILAELTKSKAEHILPDEQKEKEGKRSTAFKQLTHSLENLGNVPEIQEYFRIVKYKYILFAFKLNQDKSNPFLENSFEAFFKPLTLVPVLETEDISIPFNFKYLQIQFPESYHFLS